MCTEERKLIVSMPEIDGRRRFSEGSSININASFKDESTVIHRLRLDDSRLETYQKYDEKMRPEYKYSKWYLDRNKEEIIVERVFYVEPAKGWSTWFGIVEHKHGTMYVYKKLISSFLKLKKDNDNVGIFYRFDSNQMVCYSINDSSMVDNFVSYVFNNPEKVEGYMRGLKELEEKYKDTPYLHPSMYYPGTASQNTGLAILEL